MAEVVLKGMTKRYGDVVVVRNIDLTINDGEFLVLVGPSGCGKSTTLRMIAGLEEISDGELFIDGKLVNHVHPKDRDIAMVFQSYALYPHMSVRQNMGFGLKMRKTPKSEIRKRVDDAAQILGLDELLERKPKALSGGQRQRVAMGRAIVRNANVFLFDEPLSNLDAKLRVQMRAQIAKLHRRIGKTIIYVTHDQVEAMTLADRIVILEGGKIQQVGTPLETYDHPKNRFVAGFIGSPSMNFLHCELGPGPVLRGDGFSLELPEIHHDAVKGREGKVSLGLRPNHLRITAQDSGPGVLKAEVEVIEPMGSETLVYARLGDTLMNIREESGTSLSVGEGVCLAPILDHAHLFDAESGEAMF